MTQTRARAHRVVTMANRRPGRRVQAVGARQRQPTNWARSTSATYVAVPAATKVLLAVITLSNPGIGETIRRTRGLISVGSDQNVAVEAQVGAYGMVVVSDLAIAAGAASIPGPITEATDDGWFVWVPFLKRGPSSTALEVINNEFDSKAMRRIEEGFCVAVLVENGSATDGLLFADMVSLLTSLS